MFDVPGVPVSAIQSIPLTTIDGRPATLADWAGKVLLVVNVASKCGLTPQYEGLEKLQQTYGARGLVVLGFPANNFLGQEPGTEAEIVEFCSTNYSVTFPMFSKISVTGADQHPLYAALNTAMPAATGDKEAFRTLLREKGIAMTDDPEVLWNFEKFLVGRDGSVVGRFAPTLTPDDPALGSAIEAALG